MLRLNFVLLFTLFASFPLFASSADNMTNSKLDQALKNLSPQVEGTLGSWQLQLGDFMIQIITDEKADRMRMVSPVARSEELSKEQLYRLMQANFDSALDARYAIAHDVIWSTYIHPLSPLTESELASAIHQVISLVETFGTSFSSTEFIFGGGDNQPPENEQEDKTI